MTTKAQAQKSLMEQKENQISMTKKLMDCFKTMQVSAHLPQHEPKTFDGNDVTKYQILRLHFFKQSKTNAVVWKININI